MKYRKANIYSHVLIGIICLLTIQCYGQQYNTNISNISVKNGLSQNSILSIIEDDNGFLWVATQDGLNKHDGYTFKVYKTDPENSASIPNNYVKCIAKDKQGNLWIGTQTGLAKYIVEEDKFQRIPSAAQYVINAITINDETIYAGSESGIIKATGLSDPIFNLIENSGELHATLYLQQAGNNQIWIASENGLSLLNTTSDQIHKVDFLSETSVRSLAYFDDNLWVASSKGLFSFPSDSVNISRENEVNITGITYYQLADKNYYAICVFKDHRNTIWVGTQTKGIFQVEKNKSNLISSNFGSELFKYSSIDKIYEDYTHCLWIGTIEAGLYKINTTNKNFRLIRTEKTDPNSLTSNILRGMLKEDSLMWIGTSRGLNLLDRKSKNNQQFIHDEDDPKSISNNDVKSIDQSPDGAIWIGTNEGLNRYSESTNIFERFFAEDSLSLINDNKIRSVKAISNGTIWVGTLGGGISVINPEKKALIRTYSTNNNGIGNDNVMNIFETKSNDIYAATYGDGLFKLNTETDTFQKAHPDADSPKLLTSIHESDDGSLWVGSYGDGFYRFIEKNNDFRQFTIKDGLSNNVVYAAIPHQKTIWISTNYGLNKFDRGTDTFLNFNENDGIQSNEFNTNSYFQCPSGELFFGGVNGLTYFFPDSIEYNTQKPKLAFTDLKIFNESIRPGQVIIAGNPPLQEVLADSTIISLEHFHNSFSIEFASLDYSSPEDSKYAYQLEGLDDDWIFSDANKRNVTYSNLDPGNYTFKMKASNGDGIWNDQYLSLFLTIKPSIWQSFWFRISSLILSVSILILVVYRRINKVERRKALLELKIKEHTQEISKQNELLTQSKEHLINENKKKDQVFYILSHNVRSPLTTLVSLLKDAKNLSNDAFLKFISDSSQKVNESLLSLDNAFFWSLIQFDKLITYDELFSITGLIKENIHKLDQLLASHAISIEFDSEDYEVFTDMRMLSLIIQNLLFNSIKHSTSSSIRVSIVQKASCHRVMVSYKGKKMNLITANNQNDDSTDIHKIKSQNEKGVALGLIVSNKLANYLNCEIGLEVDGESNSLFLEIPVDS